MTNHTMSDPICDGRRAAGPAGAALLVGLLVAVGATAAGVGLAVLLGAEARSAALGGFGVVLASLICLFASRRADGLDAPEALKLLGLQSARLILSLFAGLVVYLASRAESGAGVGAYWAGFLGVSFAALIAETWAGFVLLRRDARARLGGASLAGGGVSP